ncbi:MAG: ArsR/SmtB family transcription factor [Rhizobiaceae bacterium]
MINSISIDSTSDEQLAAQLLALAHPVRLAIIRHLAASDACCNKDVVARVGLAQSTVSQHLKVLWISEL